MFSVDTLSSYYLYQVEEDSVSVDFAMFLKNSWKKPQIKGEIKRF